MNPATSYIVIWLPVFIILMQQRRRREQRIIQIAARRRKRKGTSGMKELAKRFVGKECIINTMNSSQLTGTVKEVTDGAVLLDSNGDLEAINIDYIMRLREYPRKKNGKKKSIVLD